MKKIVKILLFSGICIYFASRMPVFAYWDDNIDYDNVTNSWIELGEDGEFDYTDGDLEDKLGDRGIIIQQEVQNH